MDPFSINTISGSSVTVGTFSYGCTLHSLVCNGRDLVIGLHDPSDHHNSTQGRNFYNQIVGRYANRLPAGDADFGTQSGAQQPPPVGKMTLVGDDNGVCLHGGKQGFDTVAWEQLDSFEQSQLFSDKDVGDRQPHQLYRHLSPAGTDGFPGTLLTETLIALEETSGRPPRLRLVMRARLVRDEQTDLNIGCPVNLTWHIGYNLADFAQNENVKSHKLFIGADRTPELDERMLPTGKLLNIGPGDELDFYSEGERGRTIAQRFPSGGVDQNFVFSQIDETRPQVVLTAPDEAVSLSFRTNQSSVQCYTAGGFDSKGCARKKAHDPHFRGGYSQYGAVFLEFQHPVATVLHSELQAAAGIDTILRGDDVYENWLEIDINGRENA
ncbi:hypothetical protein ACM66B_002801 [Microbotryomycetes sp. NB124-2]